VLVSGRIGEEVTVEAIKTGAHDYVMKNSLARLSTVERGLREARERRERRRAEAALRRRDAILDAVRFAAERLLGHTDWEGSLSAVLRRLGEATGASHASPASCTTPSPRPFTASSWARTPLGISCRKRTAPRTVSPRRFRAAGLRALPGQDGLAEMRALIFELRPESLEPEGLVAALRKQAEALEARRGVRARANLCEEPEPRRRRGRRSTASPRRRSTTSSSTPAPARRT